MHSIHVIDHLTIKYFNKLQWLKGIEWLDECLSQLIRSLVCLMRWYSHQRARGSSLPLIGILWTGEDFVITVP